MRRFHPMTHREIAKVLGLSRSRVEQIERQALNKIRIAYGSDYRGPWHPYEAEGVPEPDLALARHGVHPK